jgi:ubiquitin-protein ligase
VSKTPLYIRIDCPKLFPTIKPNLVVLARVIHPDIDPLTKVI